jgi:hypothetical protein
MAMYEEKALEFFGRVDISNERRICSDGVDPDYRTLHRDVAFAYSIVFGFAPISEAVTECTYNNMISWGLDPHICETPGACDDTSTPWGLVYAFQQEIWWEFGEFDGWNANGRLSRSYNRIPYQDFRETPYVPVNDPWSLPKKTEDRWQPLLETDGRGFLYNQEHVVPHIGYTGKSMFYSDEFICSQTAPPPDYDYEEEVSKLLARMASLTDLQKMSIEWFDNKIQSVSPAFGQFTSALGLTRNMWDTIWIDIAVCDVVYEATLVVWKEKVRYDRVRPPSIAHKLFEGEMVTTYAGVDENGVSYGTQTFLAQEWTPYIRTMPHGEYPSASACVCESFAELMRLIWGTDDITGYIGKPIRFVRPAFSSRIEPGSTPAEPVTIEFNSWTEFSNICGESRIDGGMHFEPSVPAGQNLCRNLAHKTLAAVLQLIEGEVPENIVDYYDKSVKERQCKNRENNGRGNAYGRE